MLSLIIYIIERIVSLYAVIMLIYCLLTWVIHDRSNGIMRILSAITEPPLVPIRRLIMRSGLLRNSPIDFSPLILFLLLRALITLLSFAAGMV